MENLNGDASSQLEEHGSKAQSGIGARDPEVEPPTRITEAGERETFLGKKRLGKEHRNPGHWEEGKGALPVCTIALLQVG